MRRASSDVLRLARAPRYALGLIDHPTTGDLRANATSAAHDALARTLAEQSAVLLKVSLQAPATRQAYRRTLLIVPE